MHPGLPFVVAPTTSAYDFLLNWYLIFGIGAAVIVTSALAYFMVRYRDRGEKAPLPEHRVEGWKIVLVTALISITVLTAAEYQTFAAFGNLDIPSESACMGNTGHPCVHINLTAFQWGWNFTYPNGRFYLNNLTVPVGRDVVVNINSRDAFHSFGIDMLAEKEDAIPGKTNQLWFVIPSLQVASGNVRMVCNGASTSCVYVNAIRCFELCGVGHAFMDANLTVISTAAWTAWQGGA
jgi:cytochrome c oxidase subunit II